jgi:hypothetical protein
MGCWCDDGREVERRRDGRRKLGVTRFVHGCQARVPIRDLYEV